MNKREEIQKDALEIAIKHKKCGIGISMGVGKTLIGLNYIDYLQDKNMGKLRVLIVAPKLAIFDSWKSDAIKFNIDLINIEFTTYLSLYKHNPHTYDLLILDECHSLLYSHEVFLSSFKGRILGLTGTPPRYVKSEKGEMVLKYCPIIYTYITDDAISDNILNNYKIVIHKLSLSSRSNIEIKMKDKSFYTSELKNYQYWTGRIMSAIGKKQEQIASIMRMKALMGYKTKELYVDDLLDNIEDKCIITECRGVK